jgi:hypothetical protein
LPKPTRKFLAEQIGLRNPRSILLLEAEGADVLELGEDFEVWTLDTTKLKSAKSLAKIAYPTGYWYHLIRHKGHTCQIAVSRLMNDRGERRIHGLFASRSCQPIDEAINWLDETDKTDANVRLLTVPVFGLHAFWIIAPKKQRIVVIDKALPLKGLSLKTFLTAAKFIKALSISPRPAVVPGVPPL